MPPLFERTVSDMSDIQGAHRCAQTGPLNDLFERRRLERIAQPLGSLSLTNFMNAILHGGRQ